MRRLVSKCLLTFLQVPYKEYSYLEMAASLVPRVARILGTLSPTTTIQAVSSIFLGRPFLIRNHHSVVSVPGKGVVVTQGKLQHILRAHMILMSLLAAH